MPIEVVLPKVDMDMASGVIVAWKVAEGEYVREGDVLFEMETDKSVMEVESPGTGTIRALAGITGAPVAVGTPVAWIDAEAPAQVTGASGRAAPDRPAHSVIAATAGPAVSTAAVSAVEVDAAAAGTMAASAPAAPRPGAALPASPAAARDGVVRSGELRSTPFARHTARLLDVDLADVAGTGPRGRIVAKDVTAHAEARAAASSAGHRSR